VRFDKFCSPRYNDDVIACGRLRRKSIVSVFGYVKRRKTTNRLRAIETNECRLTPKLLLESSTKSRLIIQPAFCFHARFGDSVDLMDLMDGEECCHPPGVSPGIRRRTGGKIWRRRGQGSCSGRSSRARPATSRGGRRRAWRAGQARQVVDAQVGWDGGTPGFVREANEGRRHTKITIRRRIVGGQYDATLSAVLADAPRE